MPRCETYGRAHAPLVSPLRAGGGPRVPQEDRDGDDAGRGRGDRAGAGRVRDGQRLRHDQRHRPRLGPRRLGADRSGPIATRGPSPPCRRLRVGEDVRRPRLPRTGGPRQEGRSARESWQRREPRDARSPRSHSRCRERCARGGRESRRRDPHPRSIARSCDALRHEARDGRGLRWGADLRDVRRAAGVGRDLDDARRLSSAVRRAARNLDHARRSHRVRRVLRLRRARGGQPHDPLPPDGALPARREPRSPRRADVRAVLGDAVTRREARRGRGPRGDERPGVRIARRRSSSPTRR